MKYENERKEIINTGINMLDRGLTIGSWGNISLRLPAEELYAITPSGIRYDRIKPEDIVICNLEGEVVEGEKKPSIESPLHRVIYCGREDVGAVVHTHSVYVSAMAAARKPIPASVEDLIYAAGGAVRVAEYRPPGTEELGEAALVALGERNGVLLANHGAVGTGDNLEEAVHVCKLIEKGARITVAAAAVGGVVELPPEDIEYIRKL